MDANKIETMKAVALAATPQNFDSAQIKHIGGWTDCPTCGGDGAVSIGSDYCNYDNAALGVQFYGIGDEHVKAEAYYRAANPAAVLELIAEVERLRAELAAGAAREGGDTSESADCEGSPSGSNNPCAVCGGSAPAANSRSTKFLPARRFVSIEGFWDADYVEFAEGCKKGGGVLNGAPHHKHYTRAEAESYVREGAWREVAAMAHTKGKDAA